jgi:hypothetical protein
MNYTDACEGAKSNALMRLCKEIGIGLELWNPQFINSWKSRFAEKKGSNWNKKGSAQGQPQLNPPNAKAREEAERFRNDMLEEMSKIMESEVFNETDKEKAHYEVKNAKSIEELVKIKNGWKQEKEIRISKNFETELSDEEMKQPSLTEEVEENVT